MRQGILLNGECEEENRWLLLERTVLMGMNVFFF